MRLARLAPRGMKGWTFTVSITAVKIKNGQYLHLLTLAISIAWLRGRGCCRVWDRRDLREKEFEKKVVGWEN